MLWYAATRFLRYHASVAPSDAFPLGLLTGAWDLGRGPLAVPLDPPDSEARGDLWWAMRFSIRTIVLFLFLGLCVCVDGSVSIGIHRSLGLLFHLALLARS